jgi:hypothetical protein
MNLPKIEIGQRWRGTETFTVHAIRNHKAYYLDQFGKESPLGPLTPEGYPDDWDSSVTLFSVEDPVKIGQVWTDGIHEVTINSIVAGNAYYTDLTGKNACFGGLAEDDTLIFCPGWWLKVTDPPKQETESAYNFFSKVPKDHCPCGILRKVCDYHK